MNESSSTSESASFNSSRARWPTCIPPSLPVGHTCITSLDMRKSSNRQITIALGWFCTVLKKQLKFVSTRFRFWVEMATVSALILSQLASLIQSMTTQQEDICAMRNCGKSELVQVKFEDLLLEDISILFSNKLLFLLIQFKKCQYF